MGGKKGDAGRGAYSSGVYYFLNFSSLGAAQFSWLLHLIMRIPSPRILFLLLSLAWISCTEPPDYRQLIGTWKLVADSHPEDSYIFLSPSTIAIEFLDDSTVDLKQPHFAVKEPVEAGLFNRRFHYLGTSAQYLIQDDSLTVLDTQDPVWSRKLGVVRLSEDTLILQSAQGRQLTFRKQHYALDSAPALDEISLVSTNCYGPCPYIKTIIDSTGQVFLFVSEYGGLSGYFVGQVPDSVFSSIRLQFQKADIPHLKREYSANHTDDASIYISLVHRNTIVHSLYDYGNAGTAELVWAYTPLKYLYQSMKLEPLDSTAIPAYIDQWSFWFEKEGKRIALTESETFLLVNYLRKGNQVVQEGTLPYTLGFVPPFSVSFSQGGQGRPSPSEGELTSITTDGRVYTVHLHAQKPVTIDIGFNFLERNSRRFFWPNRLEPPQFKDPSPPS